MDQQITISQGNIPELAREIVRFLRDDEIIITPRERDEYRMLKEKSCDKLINGITAAKMLGVTSGYVTKMRKTGVIKATRVGNSWKYKKSDIEKYLKQRSL